MAENTDNPYRSFSAEVPDSKRRSPWRWIPVVVLGLQGTLFFLGAGLPVVLAVCVPLLFDAPPPPVDVIHFSVVSASGLIWILSSMLWYLQKWSAAIALTVVGFIVLCIGGFAA